MKTISNYIIKILSKLKKTADASLNDPEIIVAVSIPTKTKTGILCKITYIFSQILENFIKSK